MTMGKLFLELLEALYVYEELFVFRLTGLTWLSKLWVLGKLKAQDPK